ncbi:hypothetical protein [Cochleicola gelatinilyticus]|uniref:Uncharacterized protein n=1 Tax=Cochleicola gelatinilyticus TaxID=1763537 RepID=A0A167IE74_9FLAO|nr:hypothetical protein [Cochleicola gelatinilyticus]OAB79567.1 hypothetical protein ULVI_02095 [Cochleicola gelatinilyticus]
MKEELRKSIAFIAAMTLIDENVESVFDYKDVKFSTFTGEYDKDSIKIYDFERECIVEGYLSDEKYNLYDYGQNAYIDFEIYENGRKFKGYSYSTGSFYEGVVDGNMIEFYDFGTMETYSYTV